MANYIGLDVGTTTVTGLLFDADKGQVLHLAQRPNDAAVPHRLAGRAEQDPHRLRARAIEVLADLGTSGYPVAGLALTGQKHGLFCVDPSAQPLTPLISWQDQRTAERLPVGSTTLDRIRIRLPDSLWLENGCRIHHGYGAATLYWLAQQNRLPRKTCRAASASDWLAGQFAGELPQTDPSMAASWGVYSLVQGDWNHACLDLLGIEIALLPPVRQPGEQLGCLVGGVAEETGLTKGTPVFSGLGDTQAGFLGCVSDPADAALINIGTGGQICWMVPTYAPPTGAVETRPLPGNRFLRVGASLCGGAAYAWLNRTVKSWLQEFGLDVAEDTIYERLNALSLACHDSEGLRVQPTFLGTRAEARDAAELTGTIDGIGVANMRPGPLARATLEGVVAELFQMYELHRAEVAHHKSLVAAGGAAHKSDLLPQLIAERFCRPVRVPRQEGAAALGVALLISGANPPRDYQV